MSLWDTLKSLIAREAADVKQGLEGLRDKLDAELTKKEREMEASPSERIEMLQDDFSTENVFDRIEADIDSRLSDDDGQNDQVS